MKQPVKLVVVLTVGPLGPKLQYEHIVDTINSVLHYATPDRKMIVQDNSTEQNVGQRLREQFPELIVIRTPENYGLSGGLYKAESLAYLYAHSLFDYQVLIRMDVDALMIGAGIEDDAIARFEQNPNLGQLGTYKIGCNGEISEYSWPKQELEKEIGAAGWLQDRERCKLLRMLVARAQANGYELGEHILGGVSILNPRFIDKLVQENLLLREEIRRSVLQEDHIFSLLVKAVGMQLGEFGTPNDPLAVRWQGLPSSPEELAGRNKKMVHSTRYWQQMNEDAVREFFRSRREIATASA
ncbi:MAG: hypothetical protein ABI700_02835 [Chloroflexota bacterium]